MTSLTLTPLARSRCRFRDPRSHRCHQAQVGFQVCVRPGSYKVGPQTLGQSEPLDPRFSNSEIEWITKEQGGTILYGLLVRVEWRPPPPLLLLINWQPNPSPALSKRLLLSIVDNSALQIRLFCLFWLFALGLWSRAGATAVRRRTDTACTLRFGHLWVIFKLQHDTFVHSLRFRFFATHPPPLFCHKGWFWFCPMPSQKRPEWWNELGLFLGDDFTGGREMFTPVPSPRHKTDFFCVSRLRKSETGKFGKDLGSKDCRDDGLAS